MLSNLMNLLAGKMFKGVSIINRSIGIIIIIYI